MSGTEEQKNTSSGESEQSSEGKQGTSKDKGKLYTEAQIHQIKTSAGAEAGRLRKAAEQERDSLKEQLQSVTGRLNSLESEVNESRLAEIRGDPDQLRAFQREQELKKLERQVTELQRDLTRREEQLKADRAEVDKDRGVVSLAYIAAKHGLETEELESLGISDHDTLEKVAEKLATAKPKGKGGEGGEGEGEGEEGEWEGFVPDSGETTGGGEPTQEQLEAMPMEQYAKQAEKRYK